MVPKIRSCVSPCANGVGPRPPARRAHPPRPAAGVLHPRRCRHHGGARKQRTDRETHELFDELAALDADHVMQTYARLPVAFVRGEGTRLWDSEGREYLDFLSGLAVIVPRPRPPRGGRRHRRAGPHAAPRLEPLLQRCPAEAGRRARTGCWATAARSSSPTRAPRPTSAPSSWPAATARSTASRTLPRHLRPQLLPRPDAHHAGRHRPAGQAGDLPAAADGVLAGALRRHRRPRGAGRARSRGQLAAVLLEVGPGRGRCVAGAARLPAGSPGAVRPVRGAAHVRRGPDRPRAAPAVVRVRALRHPARHRHHGQGAGQRRAHRRLLGHAPRWPTPSRPATTPPPSGASRWPPGPPWRRVQIMRARERVPERAAQSGARLAEGLAATPGVASVRGLGLLLAAELAEGSTRRRPPAPAWNRGLVVNAVTPTALRFAPPLLVTDAEIDDALGTGQGRARRLLMSLGSHFLDVDDLSAPACAGSSRTPGPGRASPGQGAPGAGGQGRRRPLREAQSARTRISFEVAVTTLGGHCVDLAGRGARAREAGSRSPTWPAPWPPTAPPSGPGSSTTASSRRWPGPCGVPVLNLLSDRAHPGQAVGDLHDARGVPGSTAGGPPARLRRRRQQRGRLPGRGRRPLRRGDGGRPARPATSSTTPPSTGSATSAAWSNWSPTPTTPSPVSTPCTPTCGSSMGQEAESEARLAAFRPYQVNPDLLAAAKPDAVVPALPARPAGARRSPKR